MGCGTGAVGNYLKDRCAANASGVMEISGIDISREMMRHAENGSAYKELELIDLNTPDLSLPWADSHFDAVLSAGTFLSGHVNLYPALSEFLRVTRAGVVIMTVRKDFYASEGWEDQLRAAGLRYEVRSIEYYRGEHFAFLVS